MRPFLTAEWLDLVFANWEVPPDLVRPLVPAGTELDLFDDRAFVSLVGFRFWNTKVLGIRIPWHSNFEEINLRFYVRRSVPGDVRRGVVFVKELVPRFWIAFVARALYGEKYEATRMSHHVRLVNGCGEAAYRWQMGGRWNSVRAECTGGWQIPRTDSFESFITEHYWGYAGGQNVSTREYRVDHVPWEVSPCSHLDLEWDPRSTYGEDFAPVLHRPPASAFIARGSSVCVYKGTAL